MNIPEFQSLKGKKPIVCLTAYTTPIARLADEHCDFLLVGDSVGMVLHGLPSTVGVTMDMMILHGKAVMRGAQKALVVIDMPFGSYEASPEVAFGNAARLMRETGAHAVKLEGGQEMADTVSFLVKRGIPVCGHIGLTPQSVNVFGGYPLQGRGTDGDRLLTDALALEAAGAFAVVVEKTTFETAERITKTLKIPLIGIGASSVCDGQILVVDDMLGIFTDFKPKFVKHFANLGVEISSAIQEYAGAVRAGVFPGIEHSYFENKR